MPKSDRSDKSPPLVAYVAYVAYVRASMGTLLDLARATPGLAADLQDADLDRLVRLVAGRYAARPTKQVDAGVWET
jgi:hypothetical protein